MLCRPAHDDDAGADPAPRPEPAKNVIRDVLTGDLRRLRRYLLKTEFSLSKPSVCFSSVLHVDILPKQIPKDATMREISATYAISFESA